MSQNPHIGIYTRFNMPLAFWKKRLPYIHLDEDWIKDRIRLFDAYSLPSMRAQTDQDYKWFIGFAEGTEAALIDRICSGYENIIPIEANNQPDFIQKSLPHYHGDGHLITTRLDSDDSLADSFVAQTRAAFDNLGLQLSSKRCVISFPMGCEYDTRDKSYYDRPYPTNPFAALCEPFEASKPDIDGIFTISHARLYQKYVSVLHPTDVPLWRINIHDDNVANVVKGEKVDSNYDALFHTAAHEA